MITAKSITQDHLDWATGYFIRHAELIELIFAIRAQWMGENVTIDTGKVLASIDTPKGWVITQERDALLSVYADNKAKFEAKK